MTSTSQPPTDVPSQAPPPRRPLARRPSLADALRRYPVVALFPIIVVTAVGVMLGVRRSPTYTASSQLNVGVPNASSSATPGYELAAQQLASSYSRQATSQTYYAAVGRQAHLSEGGAATRLSSSVVPSSTTFYVDATGPSASSAIALARTATRVLTAQINANRRQNGTGQLLQGYRTLQAQANSLAAASGKLHGENASGTKKIPPAQLRVAQLAAQTAELRAQAASQRYTQAAAQGVSTNLAVLSLARSASDDRASVTERYGIIGLVAGIVIGIALAFMAARLRYRSARVR